MPSSTFWKSENCPLQVVHHSVGWLYSFLYGYAIFYTIHIWAASWQKPTKWPSTQSDQSLLCAQWVAKDPSFLHADNEDSDQTGRMPRLIWVFAGRTCHFVGFVMRRLICFPFCDCYSFLASSVEILIHSEYIQRFPSWSKWPAYCDIVEVDWGTVLRSLPSIMICFTSFFIRPGYYSEDSLVSFRPSSR